MLASGMCGGGGAQINGSAETKVRSTITNYLKSPHKLVLESGSVLESATPFVHTVNNTSIIQAKHASESSPSTIMTVASDDNLRIGTGPGSANGTHFVTLQNSDGTSVAKRNFRVSYTEDGGSTVQQGTIYHTRYSELPGADSGSFHSFDITDLDEASGNSQHSFGVAPSLVTAHLVALENEGEEVTNAQGYLYGHEIPLPMANNNGLNIYCGAGYIYYRIHSTITAYIFSGASTFTPANGDYKIVMRCWK